MLVAWVTAGVTALWTIAWLAQHLRRPDVYQSFEHINQGLWSLLTWKPIHTRIIEAHHRVVEQQGKPFTVHWWALDNIILPPKYLADLRQADGQNVNFFTNISEAFRLHTSVGDLYQHDRMAAVVKRGLNPQLPALFPILKEELDYAFKVELGPLKEWTTFKAQQLFSNIAHRAISRVLVGPELCRDDNFVHDTQSFIMSLFITALAVVKLPMGPLRELLAWPIAHLHRRAIRKCAQRLEPVVQERIRAYETEDAAELQNQDMITWSIELSNDLQMDLDSHRLTLEIIHNVWAATSAPGGLVTEMVYRLVLSPELLEPLREEAKQVITEHGWSDRALNSLVLQDSFIREINRLYPTGIVICARKVMEKDFVLSDGLVLPPGTRFAFLNRAPGELEAAKQFDGFRFARLADKDATTTDATAGSKWKASTMSQDNLVWGYGNHCCPGRFFAVRMVKLIFTKLLLEYEVEFPGMVRERPPPWEIEGQFIPNLKQEVKVRQRNICDDGQC